MRRTKIQQLTPELLRSWAMLAEKQPPIWRVRVLKDIVCTKTGERRPLAECNDCRHNFGFLSERTIYCIPDMSRQAGEKIKRGKHAEDK